MIAIMIDVMMNAMPTAVIGTEISASRAAEKPAIKLRISEISSFSIYIIAIISPIEKETSV